VATVKNRVPGCSAVNAGSHQAVGGKSVLGRPLGSVWTSDGPALERVVLELPADGGPARPPARCCGWSAGR
jgi:hypothetical protein